MACPFGYNLSPYLHIPASAWMQAPAKVASEMEKLHHIPSGLVNKAVLDKV
jgi:hypothetical protein